MYKCRILDVVFSFARVFFSVDLIICSLSFCMIFVIYWFMMYLVVELFDLVCFSAEFFILFYFFSV